MPRGIHAPLRPSSSWAPGRRSASSRSTPGFRPPCARRAGSRPRRSSVRWARSPATSCRRRAAGTGACASLLPARRRPVSRQGGRAPGARRARKPAVRLRAPVEPRRGATGARHPHPDDRARARRSRALPAPDRGRPQRDDARPPRAHPRARGAVAAGERLSEGDGSQALGVSARRRRRGTLLRRRAARPRRRCSRPWALAGAGDLDEATPLPGTAYKLEIARALVGARKRPSRDAARRDRCRYRRCSPPPAAAVPEGGRRRHRARKDLHREGRDEPRHVHHPAGHRVVARRRRGRS